MKHPVLFALSNLIHIKILSGRSHAVTDIKYTEQPTEVSDKMEILMQELYLVCVYVGPSKGY
jgi:hypothetical protein